MVCLLQLTGIFTVASGETTLNMVAESMCGPMVRCILATMSMAAEKGKGTSHLSNQLRVYYGSDVLRQCTNHS